MWPSTYMQDKREIPAIVSDLKLGLKKFSILMLNIMSV